MDFTGACAVVMPLGKHKGKTLARIGANDEGLRYLDWLIGQPWVRSELREALEVYLAHPVVSRQLDAAIEE